MPKKIATKSKVDYRLLHKRKITDYLDSLKDKKHTVGQMDEFMKKLFRMGDQVVPICLSKLKQNDEKLAPVICYALEFADDSSLVEPLLNILLMPDVSDKVKARILTVLYHYGIDAGDLPLDIIMNDFDKVASESLEEMLNDIDEDFFLIPYILDDLEEFTNEMKIAYIKDIGDRRDERAIPLLEIIASIKDLRIAEESVRALGRIKSGKALFALNKLNHIVADDSVKKVIERESQRLKFSGITMEICLPPVKLKKPVKIIISSVDGHGSRALWIAWKNPLIRRKLTSMNLLLNAGFGIKDCWGSSRISAREFNSSVKGLSKTTVIAECDINYATTLMRDALYWNEKNKTEIPYQFYFWKHILEQTYNLKPEPYKPSFSEYDMDEIATSEEYLKKTFELFDLSIFNDWFIAVPRVYDYADENRTKKGYNLKRLSGKRAEKLFSTFSTELIEPNINSLKRMLELSADFLKRAGQHELAKTVLCAHINIDSKPIYDNPFIQRIIIESIRVALNNMKNGFDMRVNPDAFD
jgi:hypothetical protein